MPQTALVTGAYGYLGSRIRAGLDAAGWRTVALTRRARAGDDAVAWQLGEPVPAAAAGADAVVHCAYDMSLTRPDDIRRVNVGGTATLLGSLSSSGTERCLVLSSMSAYEGTRQIYGQTKLAIEALTVAAGGIAIRPGLVYGADQGGMAGTLNRLSRLPLIPLPTGHPRQFPVFDEDLVRIVVGLLSADSWVPDVVGVAQPTATEFRDMLNIFATQQGKSARFVPVPWRAIHLVLRAAEAAHVPLPVRADSIYGLVYPAPSVTVPPGYEGLVEGLTTFESLHWTAEKGMEPNVPHPVGALPSVAVIIPAYTEDRWALILKAVKSAREQTVPPVAVILCIDNNDALLARATLQWRDDADGCPVVVVANGSSDHMAGVAMHAKVHGTARRFGAGSARNTAAAIADADVFAFLDDDAWAAPDWLEKLLTAYVKTGAVAVGGAPLPDYATQRPGWFPRNFDWVFGCAYEGMPKSLAPLGHLIGANMSVRRDAFETIGGFHSIDFDDLDLCMRLAAKFGSESVYYEPESVVHHYVSADRVTWRYFYRRCFFVNKEKVEAFHEMGAAANLSSERQFVFRTLRVQILQELKRAKGGDRAAFGALAAMLSGIVLAAAGHLRGRVELALRQARNSRSTP